MFVKMLALVPLELPEVPEAWQALKAMMSIKMARRRIVVPSFYRLFSDECNLGGKCKKIFNFFELLVSFGRYLVLGRDDEVKIFKFAYFFVGVDERTGARRCD